VLPLQAEGGGQDTVRLVLPGGSGVQGTRCLRACTAQSQSPNHRRVWLVRGLAAQQCRWRAFRKHAARGAERPRNPTPPPPPSPRSPLAPRLAGALPTRQAYHPLCARMAGLHMELRDAREPGRPLQLVTFCYRHCTPHPERAGDRHGRYALCLSTGWGWAPRAGVFRPGQQAFGEAWQCARPCALQEHPHFGTGKANNPSPNP
jgi:hypothetical protein